MGISLGHKGTIEANYTFTPSCSIQQQLCAIFTCHSKWGQMVMPLSLCLVMIYCNPLTASYFLQLLNTNIPADFEGLNRLNLSHKWPPSDWLNKHKRCPDIKTRHKLPPHPSSASAFTGLSATTLYSPEEDTELPASSVILLYIQSVSGMQ